MADRIDPPAFSFDGKNEAAQAAAAKQATRLLTTTGVTGESRRAIRALIIAAIRDGIDPYSAAIMIREMVGMNKPQADAATRYRRELRESGLTQSQIERTMQRYVGKKIAERAEMISRSEILAALNAGVRAAARQAVEQELLGPKTKKGWSLSGLGGVRAPCPNCVAMSKKRIPLNAKFPYPDGRKLDGPPGHPRCRCTQTVYPE